MEFNDRRSAPAPKDSAMRRLMGQGTRKDGMRTREAAARMKGTHEDMSTGKAMIYTPMGSHPAPARTASASQTILPGVRFSQPGERTVAPLPNLAIEHTRSRLQAAADQLTSRPQAGPESGLVGLASARSAVLKGSASMMGAGHSMGAIHSFEPVAQAPQARDAGYQSAQTVLPAAARGGFLRRKG